MRTYFLYLSLPFSMAKNTVSVNSDRKWLYREELKIILDSAKKRSLRDYLLILLSYRHGLRSSEAILLKFSNIDFNSFQIWVERLKGSISSNHPLAKDEVNLIKRRSKESGTEFLFPFNSSRVRQICREIAKDTHIDFNHHKLRHTCGYDMAMKGVDPLIIKNYLGHKNIQNTMVYVQGAGRQFDRLSQCFL